MIKKLPISFSALDTYVLCPRKYFYNYILRLPRKDWPWLLFGSYVHLVLEKFHKYVIYYKKRDKEFEYGELMKRAYLSAGRFYARAGKKLSPEQREEAKQILKRYIDKVKDNFPDVFYIEKWFEIEIGDFILRGAMDRVDKLGDGKYEITDYKTSKRAYAVNKNFQLTLYAYALRRILENNDIEIKKRLDFLKLDKIKEQDDTIEECDKAVEYVLATGQQILDNKKRGLEDSDWEYKENSFCNFCDFKVRCFNSRQVIF